MALGPMIALTHDAILALADRSATGRAVAVFVVAIAMHVGVAASLGRVPVHHALAPPRETTLEVEPPKEVLAPPEVPPEPTPPVATPPVARAPSAPARATRQAATPTPAAGVDVDPGPDDAPPFPAGTGTARIGPPPTPPIGPTGTPSGSGNAPPPPPLPVDRSRKPGLAGSREWACPFPPEADAENVDEALVTIRVEVDANDRVAKVTILSEPNVQGFGREARRCAFARKWTGARNRDGIPIDGSLTMQVRFRR
jgi:periplasmic protein TonB